MTQGVGGLPSEARREAGELRVRARYSLTNPKPSVCAVVSGSTSGGSRCAVGGVEGPHLRAQPRPALALRGRRPPVSIYTALFWSRALIGQPG